MLLCGVTLRMYVLYLQNLCQTGLNAADHALPIVAHATMAV
jgi:hypothetical protein